MDISTEKMRAYVEEGIGWVVFNNPARHNAVSLDMWQSLACILESFHNDLSVRVVIMKGEGSKAFVSGADISEFDAKRSSIEQKQEYAEASGRAHKWIEKTEKPLIAMIQGYCLGGGLAIAISTDIRFSTPDSKFGIPAAKLGLGYEFSGLKALCNLVGPARAKDIMFTARLMDSQESYEMGLVNFVVDKDSIEDRVKAYAKIISNNAPLTIKAAKEAINEVCKDARERDMDKIQSMIDKCFDSEDYKEGRLAFKEKRPPRFKGH